RLAARLLASARNQPAIRRTFLTAFVAAASRGVHRPSPPGLFEAWPTSRTARRRGSCRVAAWRIAGVDGPAFTKTRAWLPARRPKSPARKTPPPRREAGWTRACCAVRDRAGADRTPAPARCALRLRRRGRGARSSDSYPDRLRRQLPARFRISAAKR